ncbi:uncharacterized protein LOC110217577 [Phascolarctos cinereus]
MAPSLNFRLRKTKPCRLSSVRAKSWGPTAPARKSLPLWEGAPITWVRGSRSTWQAVRSWQLEGPPTQPPGAEGRGWVQVSRLPAAPVQPRIPAVPASPPTRGHPCPLQSRSPALPAPPLGRQSKLVFWSLRSLQLRWGASGEGST